MAANESDRDKHRDTIRLMERCLTSVYFSGKDEISAKFFHALMATLHRRRERFDLWDDDENENNEGP